MALQTTKIDSYVMVGLPLGLRTTKIDVYIFAGNAPPPPPSPYKITARITIQKKLAI